MLAIVLVTAGVNRAVRRIHFVNREREAACPAGGLREQHVGAAGTAAQQHRAAEFSEKEFMLRGTAYTDSARGIKPSSGPRAAHHDRALLPAWDPIAERPETAVSVGPTDWQRTAGRRPHARRERLVHSTRGAAAVMRGALRTRRARSS